MSVSFKALSSVLDHVFIIKNEGKGPPSTLAPQILRTPGRSCKYCPEIRFDELSEFREHHHTPWHIHNQGLALRSRKPISEEEFELNQRGVNSDSDDSDFWDASDDGEIVGDEDQDEKAVPLETFIQFSDGKRSFSVYRSLLFATKAESRSSSVTSDRLQSFLKDACNSIWAIFLFKGGKIFFGIYSLQQECFVKKKLFKKYTERRKQGGSQLLRDKSGKVAKSAGSQIRRQNELDLLNSVKELVTEWAVDLNHCQLIFWNRTFFSQLAMFQTPSVLASTDIRLRKYPFNTYKPSEEEALRCAKKLSSAHKDA